MLAHDAAAVAAAQPPPPPRAEGATSPEPPDPFPHQQRTQQAQQQRALQRTLAEERLSDLRGKRRALQGGGEGSAGGGGGGGGDAAVHGAGDPDKRAAPQDAHFLSSERERLIRQGLITPFTRLQGFEKKQVGQAGAGAGGPLNRAGPPPPPAFAPSLRLTPAARLPPPPPPPAVALQMMPGRAIAPRGQAVEAAAAWDLEDRRASGAGAGPPDPEIERAATRMVEVRLHVVFGSDFTLVAASSFSLLFFVPESIRVTYVYDLSRQRFRTLPKSRPTRLVDLDDIPEAELAEPEAYHGRPAGGALPESYYHHSSKAGHIKVSGHAHERT